MTSAEGTSWARHFGATEIHGQANTCIVARTAGDIGAEAHDLESRSWLYSDGPHGQDGMSTYMSTNWASMSSI